MPWRPPRRRRGPRQRRRRGAGGDRSRPTRHREACAVSPRDYYPGAPRRLTGFGLHPHRGPGVSALVPEPRSARLEPVSQGAQVALADDGAAEVHERLVQLGPAFPAQPEAAKEVQPGEGPLDDPAQLAQPRAVLGAAPGDDRLDDAPPELPGGLVVVIAPGGRVVPRAAVRGGR